MSKLTEAARDEPCLVRIPGVCTGGGADTVLAHYRMAGLCGTSIKPLDLIGAYACKACHDAVDGRGNTDWDYDTLRLWHAEGCFRTLQRAFDKGLIKL